VHYRKQTGVVRTVQIAAACHASASSPAMRSWQLDDTSVCRQRVAARVRRSQNPPHQMVRRRA